MTGLEFAAVAIIGVLVGRFLPNRRRRVPKAPKPVKPLCGCGHHHGYHDPQSGQCHGLMSGDPLRYNEFDHPTAWKQVPCTCRTYSGPQPLPEFYAPEIASGGPS